MVVCNLYTYLTMIFYNICACERMDDAPDLEPVFRGAIIWYYIFLRDFSYIYMNICTIIIYTHVRPGDIIIIILWYYRVRTELLRPGVTEEATTYVIILLRLCIYDGDDYDDVIIYTLATIINSTSQEVRTSRLNVTPKWWNTSFSFRLSTPLVCR